MLLKLAISVLLALSIAGCGGGADGAAASGIPGMLSLVAGQTYPGESAEVGALVTAGTRTPIDARNHFNNLGPVAALADGSAIVRATLAVSTLAPAQLLAADNSQLVRVERSGDVTPLAGFGGTTGCGPFCIRETAVTVASHPAGKAYVYDEARLTVTVIGSAGVERTFPLQGMRSDSALAVDAAENLYFFSDAGLVRRRPDGTAELLTTDPAPGLGALAVDAQGNVYAASNALYRISPAGSVQRVNVNPPLHSVRAMAVGADGSLYAADFVDFAVRKIAPGGGDAPNVVGELGRLGFRLGALPGGLSNPAGVAVTGEGLWVTSNQAVLFARFLVGG